MLASVGKSLNDRAAKPVSQVPLAKGKETKCQGGEIRPDDGKGQRRRDQSGGVQVIILTGQNRKQLTIKGWGITQGRKKKRRSWRGRGGKAKKAGAPIRRERRYVAYYKKGFTSN